MAIDALDLPGFDSGTSTGQVFASADEGESWQEIASYLPPISSVDVRRARAGGGGAGVVGAGGAAGARDMADLHLPSDAAAALSRPAAAASTSRRPRSRGDRACSTRAARVSATGSASRARRSGLISTSTSTASARHSTRRSQPASRVDVIAAISGG